MPNRGRSHGPIGLRNFPGDNGAYTSADPAAPRAARSLLGYVASPGNMYNPSHLTIERDPVLSKPLGAVWTANFYCICASA